jgi:hypothetical protein
MSADTIQPALFSTLEHLLEIQRVDGNEHPLTPIKKPTTSLVVEELQPTGELLPYKARINNLLSSLISRHAREEAKEGERYTLQTIERVKTELNAHAADHPKLQPLVTILIDSLPRHPLVGDTVVTDPRPVHA